ncbi:nonribosomal peptide synthetase [Corynebacterium yudongzhengii]|uniref:Amino acid adenylation domain-containing protein n=1 Tax=Corynebacterium yudongzhengii TaxID=2080740 RepID=A0A2U1T9U2_9CORY|nr:amino acid adenylation domain-containing protein [Corynebacterium yudongzhengii]AWB81245.1 nonribosomal peptide synthetase [Corynebacterium yudongzhengii]PWC02784.1 amino acid adenylation domain-containing protein [Corynebacterium yudongzhengii]
MSQAHETWSTDTVTGLLDSVFADVGRSAADPERLAVVDAGGQGDLTYRQLAQLSGALARRLIAAGTAAGDRIVVIGERSVAQVVAAVAVIRAGASFVPVDAEAPAARIRAVLHDAAPRIVLTTSSKAHVPAGDPHPLWLDLDAQVLQELRQEGKRESGAVLPARKVTPEEPVYLIFTSGTTGRPKGAINLHRGVATHLRWMADTFGGADQVVLWKAPIGFDVAVAEILNPLCAGGTVIVPPRGWWPGDVEEMAHLIRDHKVTVLSMVPGMLRALLNAFDSHEDTALAHLLLGGEAVPSDLARRAGELVGCRVWGLYGPSEAAMDVLAVEYTDALEATLESRSPEPGLQAPLLGWPQPQVEAFIVGPDGEKATDGDIGELVLGGPQVGAGYIGRPDLTDAAFSSAPSGGRRYRTGDLARRDPATGLFEYHGRLDEQVKIRGNRVELGEVDQALRQTPGVHDAAAQVIGDGLIGFIVAEGEPSTDSGWEYKVRRHAALLLPAYAVPDRVVLIDELPVTTNGKLDRAALSAESP